MNGKTFAVSASCVKSHFNLDFSAAGKVVHSSDEAEQLHMDKVIVLSIVYSNREYVNGGVIDSELEKFIHSELGILKFFPNLCAERGRC